MLEPLAPVESAPFWYETHSEPSPNTTESGDVDEIGVPVAKTVGVIDAAAHRPEELRDTVRPAVIGEALRRHVAGKDLVTAFKEQMP